MNRVVNVRRQFADIYMGRPWAWHKAGSPWQNPFHMIGGDRMNAILNFANFFYAPEQRWLRNKALAEIPPDASLGCWCHPLPCHVDIVAGYLAWKRGE